jgi:hypothetical protein
MSLIHTCLHVADMPNFTFNAYQPPGLPTENSEGQKCTRSRLLKHKTTVSYSAWSFHVVPFRTGCRCDKKKHCLSPLLRCSSIRASALSALHIFKRFKTRCWSPVKGELDKYHTNSEPAEWHRRKQGSICPRRVVTRMT